MKRMAVSLYLAGCVLAALALIVFSACTKHEEEYLTPWLKVDIQRPITGSNGVIVLGSRKDVFHTKVAERWTLLGVGHGSSYMVMDDDRAVLIDLHDGRGLQLVTEDAPPRRIPESFGSAAGTVTVAPSTAAIDVSDCRVPSEPAGCREVRINRYDLAGTLRENFFVALPEAYRDCQLSTINGYDSKGIPYLLAQCPPNSTQAKCVLTAPRKDGLFVYAVSPDRPWSDCSEFPRAGVSLHPPPQFRVLN